jgi:C1A family cysteine protease
VHGLRGKRCTCGVARPLGAAVPRVYILCCAKEGRAAADIGSLLSATLEAMRDTGQPQERDWPYLSAAAVDPANWAPPASIGVCFGRNGAVSAHALDAICAELNKDFPVILLMMLSRSFYHPTTRAIVNPANDEAPEPKRRHAVIAVGHGKFEGQRVLLIRNSWGAGWGDAGYGWLTEAFLAPRLYAAAKLMEEVDVSANSLAA